MATTPRTCRRDSRDFRAGKSQSSLENFFESPKRIVDSTLLPWACLEQAQRPWNADWLDFYRVKFQQANLTFFFFKRGILFC